MTRPVIFQTSTVSVIGLLLLTYREKRYSSQSYEVVLSGFLRASRWACAELLVSCRDNVCGRETLVGCLALSGRHGDSGIGAQAGLRQMRP